MRLHTMHAYIYMYIHTHMYIHIHVYANDINLVQAYGSSPIVALCTISQGGTKE